MSTVYGIPSSVVSFNNDHSYERTGNVSWTIPDYTLNPQLKIKELEARLVESELRAELWEHIANTDSLTGLYSRFKLDTLNTSFNRNPEEHRNQNQNNAILFIDLDDFGQINKKYGDSVGDAALRIVGKAIGEAVRDDDLAIRKGGDEFVVFLRGTDAHTADETVVKRLKDLLTNGLHIEFEGNQIPIKGSVGVFNYDPSLSPMENIGIADEGMRSAKRERKEQATYAASPNQYHYTLTLPGFEP